MRSSAGSSTSCTAQDRLPIMGFHWSSGGRSRRTDPMRTRSSFQAEIVIGRARVPALSILIDSSYWPVFTQIVSPFCVRFTAA